MSLYPKNKISINGVKKFLVIFYAVGFAGFLLPFSKNIFILITPFALLLNIYLLALYHRSCHKRDILLFVTVYLLGFAIEAAGVKTGLIFGVYHYGKTLGPKILEAPIIIGINWLILGYTSISIVDSFKIKPFFSILLAPLLMLGCDIIIEQVAPKMDMWFWEDSMIPIRNYIAWYITGLIIVTLFKIFKTETKNDLAKTVFICQFIFFMMLFLLIK